ncbi:MAG: hypothetical protein OXE94_09485 [Aestuariivita sp.]|nr:hypothetical protein [Aestuariivita sp.]
MDWIRLALHLAERPELGFGNEKCIKNPFCDYNKNQRDVDLLVAFPADCDSQVTHLVMIEAKAYSSWENDQLKAKAETLKCIFGKDGKRRNKVLPYFVLMSDKEPERVNVDCWPEWMTENKKKPIWLKYKLPRRKQAVRCDPQGKNSANGGHLRLDDVGSCQEQTDELVKQAS